MKQNSRKLISSILLSIFVVAIFITGCSDDKLPSGWPTNTPTFTPTRTCPSSLIATPDSFIKKPSLFIFLIDTDITYQNFVAESFSMIANALPKAMEPGDRYIIFRLGEREWDNSKMLNYHSSEYDYASIPPFPTNAEVIYPTFIPTKVGQSSLEKLNVSNENNKQLEEAQATATQLAFLHGCAVADWNEQYEEDAEIFEKTRVAENEKSSAYLAENLFANATQQAILSTPEPQMIFEGIAHSSTVFSNECKEYGTCKLILFSDMQDWREEIPSRLVIDLTGVDVMSVMLNCEDTFEPSCKPEIDYWSNQFNIFSSGTSSDIEFLANDNDTEKQLIEFLRRK